MSSSSAQNYPEIPAARNPDFPGRPHLVALADGYDCEATWTPPVTAVAPNFPTHPFDTWTAERNTLGHGVAFAQLFGHICRFSYSLGRWFVYDGRVWLLDDGSKMGELRQRARMRFQEDVDRYRRVVRKSQGADDEDASDTASKDVARFASHVRETLSTPKALALMVDAAVTTGHRGKIESLAVDTEGFDTHRHLLNTLNCVLDLRTGVARPHDPEFMLTKLAPVVYVPTAQAPRFVQTVSEIMGGDPERVAFLQRVLGYLITGESRERKVVVFLGRSGSNGKTTISNILTQVLGTELVITLPGSTLVEKGYGGGEIDVGLASINGNRVVIALEPKERTRFDTGVVKALTGGDIAGPMARRPHQRELQAVKPGAKILMLTNHVPSWENDQAFNERFLLVPFEEQFRDGAEHKDLALELFSQESSGILNWLVEGARRYYECGLEIPKDIELDTAELRLEGDPAEAWFQSCCSMDIGSKASVSALYDSYRWHVTEVLGKPAAEVASLTAFSQSLSKWKGKRVRERVAGSPNPIAMVHGIRLLVGVGGQALSDL